MMMARTLNTNVCEICGSGFTNFHKYLECKESHFYFEVIKGECFVIHGKTKYRVDKLGEEIAKLIYKKCEAKNVKNSSPRGK